MKRTRFIRKNWWLVVVFALAALMMGGNGIRTYQGVNSIVTFEHEVTHTQSVLTHLESVLTTVDDAETSQRGYILTRKPSYLQPYQTSRTQIGSQEGILQSLIAGEPSQGKNMAMLLQLINTKFVELQATITLEQQGQTQQAQTIVLSGQGKQVMDTIRQLITQMETSERAILAAQNSDVQTQLQKTLESGFFVTLMSITVLIIASSLSIRAIRQREHLVVQQGLMIESEQLARQQAEQAVQTRDQFLSIAAHEIRTPLTTLIGGWQMLRWRSEHHPAADRREDEEIISEQMDRLRELTDLVFDISRLDTGKLTIQHDTIDVALLTKKIAKGVQFVTEHHTLVVETAETPLLVRGDALRLEQVLNNLIQNAIKYSPHGGTITVQAVHEEDEAQIRVSDEGMGIPASDIPHLFERFYRASNADPLHINGLGIGLYVSNEIILQHEGRIQILSEEGRGSRFSIHLPLQNESTTVSKGIPALSAS